MRPIDSETKKILNKYGAKLDIKGGTNLMDAPSQQNIFTREYNIFRQEALQLSNTFYERACNFATKLNIAPKKEDAQKIQEAIDFTHLNITPQGSYSLATLAMGISVILGFLILAASYLLFEKAQLFLSLFFIIGGVLILKPLSKYPIHLASKWRLQASNQMVLCILYIVMYMRHTSNLEHAIKFAGEHIGNPLALDLRKILWDVETQRYSTIKEALDKYLEGWQEYNLAFVESFHLIMGSLTEGDKKRRLNLLEKSLEIMLEGTYEGMLHFAQDVKSPITTLHMLGVILPILGLIVLPLLGSFLGVKWYHLALVYNLILPVVVYFIGYNIMSKRPVGYKQADIYETSEKYQNMRMLKIGKEPNISYMDPKNLAIALIFLFLVIGFSPLIFHLVMPNADMALPEVLGGSFLGYKLSEIEDGSTKEFGPFGLGATLMSLIIPFGIAIALSTYYKIRSKKLIAIRNETKKLEKEFQGALYQVGNRLGGGFPPESIFGDVSRNLKGTPTGKFFQIVDRNIRSLGMNIEQAIFDDKIGAINFYPSSLIESSMKVLIETAKKGPSVASKALMSISLYLDRINKVNERLKDLLAEIISSMRAQVSFLAPVISGIVVGIGSMITAIMTGLSSAFQIGPDTAEAAQSGAMGLGNLAEMFPLQNLMPPFFFQIVVGLYLIEIVIVLSIMTNGIEAGIDNLNKEHLLGKNLNKSILFYLIVAAITIIAFNLLATMISGKVTGTTGGF
ncbi:MAG: hypothetical protein U9Q69_06375 [Nanoarchaeota archaeon]|nr:hypothetical protein [Nanoarchaeota archaeon]